ncbi:hypothetical protein AURDEDRAFT_129174 [Auricularia subglabra TFB-10046 SS5]|uniref:Uncharacterized protein n=1 Tax=Auricularia subglabra (strain TFB-10046 / SS5) TaxID=717982 RepID=J0DBA6_AURST|nr:hypothetical protein AURDEDRAFT_129174 [Auricularia subglabra TFB-10046 SS5]
MAARATPSIVRKTFLDLGNYQVVPHNDRRITYSAVSSGDHSLCMRLPPPCTNQWWLEPNTNIGVLPSVNDQHVSLGPSVHLTFVISGASTLLILGHADGLAQNGLAVELDRVTVVSTPISLTEAVSGVIQKVRLKPSPTGEVKVAYTGKGSLGVVGLAIDNGGEILSSLPVSAPGDRPQSTSRASDGLPYTPVVTPTPRPQDSLSTGSSPGTAVSPQGPSGTASSTTGTPDTISVEPSTSPPGNRHPENTPLHDSSPGLGKSGLAGVIAGAVCAAIILVLAGYYLRRRLVEKRPAKSRYHRAPVEPYALYPSGEGSRITADKHRHAVEAKITPTFNVDDGAAADAAQPATSPALEANVAQDTSRSLARPDVPAGQWMLIEFILRHCRHSVVPNVTIYNLGSDSGGPGPEDANYGVWIKSEHPVPTVSDVGSLPEHLHLRHPTGRVTALAEPEVTRKRTASVRQVTPSQRQ